MIATTVAVAAIIARPATPASALALALAPAVITAAVESGKEAERWTTLTTTATKVNAAEAYHAAGAAAAPTA
jgi:hypothetical protein